MNGFFQHADLRLSEQSPSPKVIGNSPTDRQVQNLLFSCECYSQSGMPVVFPVDARGLYAKDGVYEQNDWQEAAPSTGHPAHCVVLVGYHHEEQLLLFNDPSAMPFMLMHVTEAITLGCIKSDYGTTYADNGVFMPVTPTEVRMLLAYQRNIEDNGGPKQRPGLLTLSRWMSCICRSLEHKNGPLSRKPHQDKLLPRFLLCQHNDADLNRIPQLSTQYRDEWSEPLQKLMARISSARRWQAAHWTWVEMLNDSIWVWNAEMETPRRMPKGESNADCIRKGLQWVLGIVYRNDKGEFQYHPFAWPA